MKTAVSLPDEVFQGADGLRGEPKSHAASYFSDALREYLARHAPDEITQAMNATCLELKNYPDDFVASAARRVLERSEW